ncbi:MAG: putative zinc-binding metallopeptidase, partial [Acidobacteriota bacterium]
TSFDKMIDSWFPITYMLNNLNRGLGLSDPYPFVLSQPAIEKLRYVHDMIERYAIASRERVEATT